MATDMTPAAVPIPPDPGNGTATPAAAGQAPAKGFLASVVAPVEPARPTFNLTPTTGSTTQPDPGDGVLDRSAPGVSSASFRDAEEAAGKDPAGQKRKAQGSIWKAWWLAGAQRWGKGGGTANKRLDVRKVQAQANQVKENRTTAVTKSGGLPVRNSGGSGGGSKGNAGKSGGDSRGKGAVNSAGNGSSGSGRGGTGGGRGPGGSSGSGGSGSGGARNRRPGDGQGTGKGSGTKGPNGSGSSGKDTGTGGAGKNGAGHNPKSPKHPGDKGSGKTPGTSGSGSAGGGSGKQGSAGKNGAMGKAGGAGASGGQGGLLKNNNSGKPGKGQTDPRSPLQKSREIGHKDGSSVRNAVDHVKAYKDGAVDGYRDKRDENAKEHGRLDKAHDKHKAGTHPKGTDTAKGAPPASPTSAPLQASVQGHTVTITDDNTPMEDPFMSKPTPIQAQGINAKTITLGDGFLKPSVSRGELRRFKDYEGRLEARIDGLAKVGDAAKTLSDQAEKQAGECQKLTDQAKGIEGGEKLVGALTKLADQAKAQASEAIEVHKRALRAHDFAKAVLSNIQTRYAPLYQAVVDSDETKPAELKFYADRGVSPSDTALAA